MNFAKHKKELRSGFQSQTDFAIIYDNTIINGDLLILNYLRK